MNNIIKRNYETIKLILTLISMVGLFMTAPGWVGWLVVFLFAREVNRD